MRVLHLISSGGMYGAEAVILQLSAEMEAGSHGESIVGVFSHHEHVTPELHSAGMEAGVASELISCRGQLDFSMSSKLRSLSERLRIDVVHAHGYKADIYAFFAFSGRRRPALVSTCHTWYDNDLAVRVYGAADRWVLRHYDQVVAVSAEVQGRLLRAGVNSQKICLIQNGVSVPDVPPDVQRTGDLRTDAPLRVGLVGRLAPEKGVDVFLRAVAQVQHAHPEAEFVVAGDGPERESLHKLMQDSGLGTRVKLLGKQTDMQAFYASLDLLVSASRQEGLPMAMLEGMALGLPVVATRVGEVPNVVGEGQTGLLVSPGDSEELAVAMEKLLADAPLRARFGLAGRQRVLDAFSAADMTAKYVKLYERALDARRSKQPSANPVGGTQ